MGDSHKEIEVGDIEREHPRESKLEKEKERKRESEMLKEREL